MDNQKWTLKHTFGVILAIIAGLFILAHVVLFFYCTEYGCPAIVEMGKPVKVEQPKTLAD